MRAIYPGSTFKILIGTSVMLALLLIAAVSRAILAGCPEGWHEGGFACLFLPTHTDLGIYLLGHTFMGAILLGTYSWLVLCHRQWTKMSSLTRNLAVLRAPDSELEPLTWHLGLKDKVHLLDSEAPICFCAGFFSPRIYLSRGMVEKLTPEEMDALLLHEKHHLKNYAPLKILLGRLVVSALFFIPALRDIFEYYLIDKEIAADRSAIQYQGQYRGIASTLEKLLHEHSIITAEGCVAGGSEALEYRIDHLTGHTPQRLPRISIPHLVTSVLIIAFTLATILAPLPGSHP